MTYTVDIEPYHIKTNHIPNLIGQSNTNLYQLVRSIYQNRNQTHMYGKNSQLVSLRNNLLVAVRRKEGLLNIQCDRVKELIQAIRVVSNPNKSQHTRAMLSLVDSALSHLFGTATKGNLEQLQLASSSQRFSSKNNSCSL